MNKLLLCAIGFVLCCSLSACKTDVAADINLDEDVVTQSNFSGAEAKTESVLPENEPETHPPPRYDSRDAETGCNCFAF